MMRRGCGSFRGDFYGGRHTRTGHLSEILKLHGLTDV